MSLQPQTLEGMMNLMAMGTFLIFIFLMLVIVAVVVALVATILIARNNRRRQVRGFEVQPIEAAKHE